MGKPSIPTTSTGEPAGARPWWDPARLAARSLFPLVLQVAAFAVFVALMLAGWGRRGVPGRVEQGQLLYTNLATLGFWVLWFMGLVLLFPAIGRLWCTVCPVGGCNDLLARVGLKRSYPRRLQNAVITAGLLLGLTLVAEVFGFNRYPDATAGLLLAVLVGAVVAGLLFRGRVFCRFWCPIGGMAGLHTRLAPAEIGFRDREVCRRCEQKPCYHGGTRWYRLAWGAGQRIFPFRRPGCPAFIFPPEAARTGACIMCTQCFKNCPYDNLRWGVRPPLTGLWKVDTRDRSEALLVIVLTGIVFYRLARFWGGMRDIIDWPAEAVAAAVPAMTPLVFKATKLLVGFALWPLFFFGVLALAVKAASEVSLTPWPAGGGGTAGPRYDLAEIDEKTQTEEETWRRKRHTFWGYLAVYAFAFLPLVGGAYAAFAAIKLNEKLGYLPLALGDPAGVRTWLAISELQIIPAPESLVPLQTVRWLALALVAAGAVASLWSVGRIGGAAYGEGTPAARRGAHAVRAAVLFLSAIMLWCVRIWLFRG